MSGKQRKLDVFSRATFSLPSDLTPANLRCIQLMIPDDLEHLAALQGAISLLANWNSWQRDDNQSGTTVAQLWKNVISQPDFMTDCEGNPIVLIEEWEDEMCLRCNIRFNNGVLQVLDCGIWVDVDGQGEGTVPSGVIQPQGTNRPAPGSEKCYVAQLTANNNWQLPFAVQTGDTITISEIQGYWNDGSQNWFMPTGIPAIFGFPVGAAGHAGGDPSGTFYHMQLVALVAGTYYSGTGGSFTIGAGVAPSPLVFTANDGSLSDNQGSISFKVCVTAGGTPPAANWCYSLDLSLSPYNGVPYTDQGIYVLGSGFEIDNTLPFDHVLEVHFDYSPDISPSYIKVYINVTVAATAGSGSCAVYTNNGQWTRDDTLIESTGLKVLTVSTAPGSTSDLFPTMSGTNLECTIYRIDLEGVGDNPYGVDNC